MNSFRKSQLVIPFLAAMLAAGISTACTAVPAPVVEPTQPPPKAATQPLPAATHPAEQVPSAITPETMLGVRATVQSVAQSARAILLAEVVDGVEAVAVTAETTIEHANGTGATLEDIAPGAIIEASGYPGGQGALLAVHIRIMSPAQAGQVTNAPEASPVEQPVSPDEIAWQQVEVPEAGLVLDVPADWERQGSGWSWAAPGEAGVRLGVNWNNISPGWQETAMLPNHAEIVNQAIVGLDYGQGTDYTLRLSEPAAAGSGPDGYERHVIVQVAATRGYDFFLTAQSVEQINAMVPVLEHVLASVAFAE